MKKIITSGPVLKSHPKEDNSFRKLFLMWGAYFLLLELTAIGIGVKNVNGKDGLYP